MNRQLSVRRFLYRYAVNDFIGCFVIEICRQMIMAYRVDTLLQMIVCCGKMRRQLWGIPTVGGDHLTTDADILIQHCRSWDSQGRDR